MMLRKLFLCGTGSLCLFAAIDALAAHTMRRLGRHLAGGEPPHHEQVTGPPAAAPFQRKIAA